MREGALRRRRLAHQLLDLAARVARLPLRSLAAAVVEIAGADTSISDEREGSVLAVTGATWDMIEQLSPESRPRA